MITKCKSIKNLAVFENFDWDSSLRDTGNNVITFCEINIIYGRNYSGKTTLSRVIRSLETGIISDKYESPEFSLSFNDGTSIDEQKINSHDKKIRVFNEDFVRENLRFITNPDDDILPFAILGGNASLEQEIQSLKDALGKNEYAEETGFYLEHKNLSTATQTALNNYQLAFSQLDSQLSQKATNREYGIKYQPEKFGDQNYTKPKLEQDIRIVLQNNFKPISREDEQNLIQLLRENQNPEIPVFPPLNNSFEDLLSETELLVGKEVAESGKIDELVKNAVLNRWVREGKQIHQEKLEQCGFCGNTISEDRWLELDRHFDEESQQFEKALENLISKIEVEIQSISALSFNKTLFYSKYHELIDRLNSNLQKIVRFQISSLRSLQEQNNQRRLDIIHPKVFVAPRDYSNKLIQLLTIYEKLRVDANEFSNLISAEQNDAKTLLRLKEVYNFINEIQYENESVNIATLKAEFDDVQAKLNGVSTKITTQLILIREKERLMNDEEKGALKVNEYLNNFFGHDFLTLQAIQDESLGEKQIKFEIIRNGKKAHHLSEGESSLIAFCYFMARLEDIETKDCKPIIWIDDPISSLDSNHIFFVYSLINAEIVANKNFEQLFLSTHNLDFLKYLKRLPGANSKNNSRYFIITREGNKSNIKPMPKYLKDYVTEFNFLFHQIYLCASADSEDDTQHSLFYNFANNTRKFLEAFLFYKYPNAIDDDKLTRFFGDNQQASAMTDRINNEFSHLEGLFERSMVPIDIPEMKKTATFLLRKIEEKDKDQYDSLLKSIGIEPA